MLTCSSCAHKECAKAPSLRGELPANCPIASETATTGAMAEYRRPEVADFYANAGYAAVHAKENRHPRIAETVDFCRRMGYRHIGIASCIGSQRDADYCARIFRREGFEVETVICCAGGLNELEIGVKIPEKYHDGPNYCAACNPIGQAKLLNEAKTEFNLVLGLCVGHDSLFLKYAEAPCSILTVKDRLFPSNPVAGIYYAYGCLAPEGNSPLNCASVDDKSR